MKDESLSGAPKSVTIDKSEYEHLLERSKTLEKIEDAVDKAYATDENGELIGEDDLGGIGESVALILGYL